jgi:hypothetical protein
VVVNFPEQARTKGSTGYGPGPPIKKYDESRSPQRLLESDALLPAVKAELTRLYGLYNPVQLQYTVNKAVLALREALAARSLPPGRTPAA